MHKDVYICDGCKNEIDPSGPYVAASFDFYSTDEEGVKTRDVKFPHFHTEASCFRKWLESVTSE